VIVVGAGVIGLSCAIRLAEGGYDVAVFARDLPLETTSSVAAAIWYPYLSAPEDRVAGWSRTSYEEFAKLAEVEPSVQLLHGREFLVERTPDPRWADVLPDLTRVGSPPVGFADGWSFTTPVIDMPAYLPALVKRLEDSRRSQQTPARPCPRGHRRFETRREPSPNSWCSCRFQWSMFFGLRQCWCSS